MALKLPSFKTIVVAFISGIIGIQVLSLLINQIFPEIELIKAGNALLLVLAGVGIITLFNVGFNLEQLRRRETLIFVIIVFGLILAGFYFGEQYFPEIFTISPDISFTIKQTVGSIMPFG